MVNSRHFNSSRFDCAMTNMGAYSFSRGEEKYREWTEKYYTIIQSLQRIKNNFTAPFAKEEYWKIGNALIEFERLENERMNDITNGLLTDLLQEIVSGCNLAKTLDFYFTLCKNELSKCKENEKKLLDQIEDLTNPDLAQKTGIIIDTSIKLPKLNILSIIGKINIYIAWYYLTYCKGYNPLAVINPQKYLYIKSIVNEMGSLENALENLEKEEKKLLNIELC